MLPAYKIILTLIYPFLGLFLKKRLKNNKESAVRYYEKLGKKLPEFTKESSQKVIWFCAASIGESLSVLPIIKELCLNSHKVVITTTTLSSANVLKDKLPSNAIHVFTPLDSPICINRFLKHFKPDVFVLVEEEFWPNLISLAKKSCKKCYFLNAKFSKKSMLLWTKHSFVKSNFVKILKLFDTIFVSSEQSSNFFSSLNIKYEKIKSLKYYTVKNFTTTSKSEAQDQNSQDVNITNKNIILALSTHKGEEEIIFKALKVLKTKVPRLLLILMPRHLERLTQIKDLLETTNLKYSISSQLDKTNQDNDVVVIDKFGLVDTYCKISNVVFVGGSLFADIGGHNILEPSFFEKFVITGPYNENFEDIVDEMVKKNAIVKINSLNENDMSLEISAICTKAFQNTTYYKQISSGAKKHTEENSQNYLEICQKITN